MIYIMKNNEFINLIFIITYIYHGLGMPHLNFFILSSTPPLNIFPISVYEYILQYYLYNAIRSSLVVRSIDIYLNARLK